MLDDALELYERRFQAAEWRETQDGVVVEGVAVPYAPSTADIAGMFKEQFLPGAFGDLSDADVLVNRQHDRAMPLARSGKDGGETRIPPSKIVPFPVGGEPDNRKRFQSQLSKGGIITMPTDSGFPGIQPSNSNILRPAAVGAEPNAALVDLRQQLTSEIFAY